MSEETLGHMMIRELQEEKAALRSRVAELEAERGTLPDGAHPDEAKPRAETWLAERANWTAEVERIRAWVAVLETQLATTRARHIREAVEGLGRGTQSEGDDIVEIGNTGVWVSRAALLDALGGTTPPLDETGGKA